MMLGDYRIGLLPTWKNGLGHPEVRSCRNCF
jgi:hypothetical protein